MSTDREKSGGYYSLEGTEVPVRVWGTPSMMDSQTQEQIRKMASMPGVVKEIAVMPDCHLGKGACVGTVMVSENALIPAAVGVDIGCGMMAVQTDLKLGRVQKKLKKLRALVEEKIPVGFNHHKEAAFQYEANAPLWKDFQNLNPKVQSLLGKAILQTGSLGGGNHFIECCVDEKEGVWLMLHSGSRHIGNATAQVHIEEAKGLMKEMVDKPEDKNLAWLVAGTKEFEAYRHDLLWCQDYARLNRDTMMSLYQEALREVVGEFSVLESVCCHHNYAQEEEREKGKFWVTRKGAIKAGRGDLGIIPGSMGARSFIVRGLGNEDSFCSASHGAGRKMSRTQAQKKFSVEDLEQQTKGVECRKDRGVIDEIPGAYKDIDKVMAAQSDLVEVVAVLKQVMCVKG